MKNVFLACAIIGGVLLVLRLVMQFLGTDADADGHFDLSDSDGHIDSDAGFKLFSLQAIIAFVMMFGLVGWAMMQEEDQVQLHWALLAAVVGGGLAAGLVAWLFSAMKGLQASGTLNLENAVGQRGTIYLNIPAEGTGKVQIEIQGRLEIFDAVSGKKEEFKTGDTVLVTQVVGEKVLVVERG